jgi:two-component system phosphate regulon response regulator PhoB
LNEAACQRFDALAAVDADGGDSVKKILIVEDQSDIRKLIRMTLEFEQFETNEASNGVMGLQLAREWRPDLVLLDVMMPGELDGLQVCERIKQDPALAGMKVVILSARGQAKDTEAGKRAGADDYLIKPFSPVQLVETIERIFE